MSVQRVYGGVPADQRRDDRHDRLIDAAFELLATEGTRGLTLRKVAAAAGVSTRHVYEGFLDLEDLRCQAFDTAAEQAAGLVLDAISAAAPDTRSQLTAVIEAIAQFTVDQPHKLRLMLTDSFGDPTLLQRRLRMTDTFATGFSFYVRDFLGESAPPGPAVQLAARFLVGATSETFTAWLEGSFAYPQQKLVEDTVELFLGAIEALKRISH